MFNKHADGQFDNKIFVLTLLKKIYYVRAPKAGRGARIGRETWASTTPFLHPLGRYRIDLTQLEIKCALYQVYLVFNLSKNI